MSTAELELVQPADRDSPVPARGTQFVQRHWAAIMSVAMLGIGFVSAYDVYLTITTAPCLPEQETNMVARRIMSLDDSFAFEQVALFLGLKCAGTVIVLTVLSFMGMQRDRRAMPVAFGVLACQLSLLYVLCVPTEL